VEIVRAWLDRPGLGHLSLAIGPAAVRASGLVLAQLERAPIRVGYEVTARCRLALSARAPDRRSGPGADDPRGLYPPARTVVEPAAQDYTKLGPNRFRDRGLASGFTAELTVDDHELVVDYPPVWRRGRARP